MSQIGLFFVFQRETIDLISKVVNMYGNGITDTIRVNHHDLLMSGCLQTYVLTANQDSLKDLMNVGSGLPQ